VPGPTRALVLSLTDLASDPRVDRQIAALRASYEVVGAGLAPSLYDDVDFIDIATPKLGLRDGVVGLARLLARRYETAYWRHPRTRVVSGVLRNVSVQVVVTNDLVLLPIALRLGRPVVFDAHEYAPTEFSDRPWWRFVIAPYASWLCRIYISGVAGMMTVGEGIAEAYEREFGVRATVVTNAPPYADLEPSPVGEPVRILHHGLAQRGRGLEEMIHVADLLNERFTLDLVLVEADRGYRDELVRRAAGNARVRVLPPVPMREIVRMANGYDIGLFLLPPNNFSRQYALPNKLFEFIQGRLAVAIGPSPEMAAVVQRCGCGIVAPDFQPESLAALLNALDADAIAAFKHASHAAAAELCAERNQELVLNVVQTAAADETRADRPSSRPRHS
jgi:hypothetical protein